jgi:hypothetical protein
VALAIRTRRRFFRSRPHSFHVAMALGSVVVAVVLPLLAVGRWFRFVTPPPLFAAFLIGATASGSMRILGPIVQVPARLMPDIGKHRSLSTAFHKFGDFFFSDS